MLPLKLVRSLVLGETITNTTAYKKHSQTSSPPTKTESDLNKTTTQDGTFSLLFLPTKELITDTYRLATIARDMGMDLHPTPSLSHIIFTYPSSSSSLPWSSNSLSSTNLVLSVAVPLPFPSLTTSSLTDLKAFVSLTKGHFKLVFLRKPRSQNVDLSENHANSRHNLNWDCCNFSLYEKSTGQRIESMNRFLRAMAGKGWSFYKGSESSGEGGRKEKVVYLFRKVERKRVIVNGGEGECRVREVRLPALDFRNSPLRILQFIVLMTDDVFLLR